jgi:hypothetical protein
LLEGDDIEVVEKDSEVERGEGFEEAATGHWEEEIGMPVGSPDEDQENVGDLEEQEDWIHLIDELGQRCHCRCDGCGLMRA